jgi:protein-S-isoprenylcysteine O-methyltransferase Ste14
MRAVHWIVFVIALVGTAVLVLASGPTTLTWGPRRIIGCGLLVLVFAWIAIARIQLGRSFSVTPQATQLVTTGVYARIRHPIYLASPFLLLAFSLVMATWWPLLLLVAVIPMQIARARREEAILRTTFGAEYDRYRAQTWL